MWHGSGEMILKDGFWDSAGCFWLLGYWCWQPLVVGNSWILLFPHLYLLCLSSLWLALVYAMMRLNMSIHTTAIRGGGGDREHVKLLHNSNCPSYPLIIHIT